MLGLYHGRAYRQRETAMGQIFGMLYNVSQGAEWNYPASIILCQSTRLQYLLPVTLVSRSTSDSVL